VDQSRLAHGFRKVRKKRRPALRFRPATPARWRDLERLFGERGACGGCWCMAWRLPHSQFQKQKGAGNKRALRRIVQSGHTPGVLAYAGRDPVGWCSVAPRAHFRYLERSRVLAPVDEREVWSVSCLFVARPFRKRGLSVRLLKEAVALVRRRGGRIVEGYPVEVERGALPDVFVWTGLTSAYRRAGFREAARRSAKRPVMRFYIGGRR
jgi:GNAT superfamily N-acetyltransferase